MSADWAAELLAFLRIPPRVLDGSASNSERGRRDLESLHIEPTPGEHAPAPIPRLHAADNVLRGYFNLIEDDVGGCAVAQADVVDIGDLQIRGIRGYEHDRQILVAGVF